MTPALVQRVGVLGAARGNSGGSGGGGGLPTGDSDWLDVLLAAGGIGLFAIAAFVVFLVLRARIFKSDHAEANTFTLAGLRELHRRGDLSDEEFEKAKAALLGQLAVNKPPAEREAADAATPPEPTGRHGAGAAQTPSDPEPSEADVAPPKIDLPRADDVERPARPDRPERPEQPPGA